METITLENYKEVLKINSSEEINWDYICEDYNLSNNFIREFEDKVDWRKISIYQILSEIFIRKFQNQVDWYWISACQKLSEEFIIEFKDIVNWSLIIKHQKLTEEFIKENKKEIKMDKLREMLNNVQLNEEDYFQSIIDIAYKKWQENDHWQYIDMVHWFHQNYGDFAKFLLLMGSLNGQVCNGGILQFYFNGYGDGQGGYFEMHDHEIPLFHEMIKSAEDYTEDIPSLKKLIELGKNFNIEIDEDEYIMEMVYDEEIDEEYEEEVQNYEYGEILNQEELNNFDTKYYTFNDDIIKEIEIFLKNNLK